MKMKKNAWLLLALGLLACSDSEVSTVQPNNTVNNTNNGENNRPDMDGDMSTDTNLNNTTDMDPDLSPLCPAETVVCDTAAGVECCDSSTACLFDTCTPIGTMCDDQNPCPRGEYCEPSVDRCVDLNANPTTCVYIPPVGEFNPVEAWTWTGSTVAPEYDQVMMMPAVANLTDDDGDGQVSLNDIPDVVFVTFRGNQYTQDGVVRVVSGLDGSEHWNSSDLPVPFFAYGGTIPALGDITGDGVPEILISAGPSNNGLYAIKADGSILWHQPGVPPLGSLGPSIANLDNDGPPEIITANRVLGSDGRIICNLPTSGGIPVIADVNLDGILEIVHGPSLYTVTNIAADDGTGCTAIQSLPNSGGYIALANFDDDDQPEIAQVIGGQINLLKQDGTALWSFTIPLDAPRIESLYGITDCSPALPQAGQACTSHAQCGAPLGQCANGTCRKHTACNPGGGAPTVADFDGDGKADIAVATRWYYLVLNGQGEVMWAHATKDFSSAVTGSSVFDFEGDGKAEVVYNDELFLRVYSGSGTGTDANGDGFNDAEILLEIPNSSGTLLEYPLIVDVDNDGNAEIVVAANNYSTAGSDTKGIKVYRDAADNWVGTRRIWNQHAYHVTNINEDGTVPLTQTKNWQTEGLNNFRQNVQGDGLFNAPNFQVEIFEVIANACVQTGVRIRFQITNKGALGVRAGTLPVSIYVTPENGVETLLETRLNTKNLPPGGEEDMELLWQPGESLASQRFTVRIAVDDDGTGGQRHNECQEDDNVATKQALCQVIQ